MHAWHRFLHKDVMCICAAAARAQRTRPKIPLFRSSGNECLSTKGHLASAVPASPEEVHSIHRQADKLDHYLDRIARNLASQSFKPVETLYNQYQHEAGTIIPSVVPYEETPPATKRADVFPGAQPINAEATEGDGIVLVVHAKYDKETSRLMKVVVCSGFVVDASVTRQDQGDTIVTCAHTLDEVSLDPKGA